MSAVVATTYMDEASLCDNVLLLEKAVLHLKAAPAVIASAAAGRTCLVSRTGVKLRNLQAALTDDRERVLDAVPSAGGVHVLLSDGVTPGQLAAAYPELPRNDDCAAVGRRVFGAPHPIFGTHKAGCGVSGRESRGDGGRSRDPGPKHRASVRDVYGGRQNVL